MSQIRLGNRTIAHGEPVYVIAEAGVNHNGDISLARELVDIAANSGADAIKFQTFCAEEIILRHAPKAQYHIETTGEDNELSWFDLLKSQEMNREMHEILIEYCHARSIQFLSTPYDKPSVDLLDELDVPLIKVASTDANNYPFLEYIASKGRPVIYSTAMSTLDEIRQGVELFRSHGIEEIAVTQCTGSYPAPLDQANLRAMDTIARACSVAVGYSDHVPGNLAGIAAIAMGACVYEKHFTKSRNLPGPDHRASLEPNELMELIYEIRGIESAMGDGDKRVMPCELDNRPRLRKYLVASCAIQAGETFTTDNVMAKRTGGEGLEPVVTNKIVGKTAKEDIGADEILVAAKVDGFDA